MYSPPPETGLGLRQRALVSSLGALGQGLLSSLRLELGDLHHYTRLRGSGQPVIFCMWHSQLLLVIRHARQFRVTTLASPSLDGEIGAQVGERFGAVTIRGDERHSPLTSLRRLSAVVSEGIDLGLFADGPLGPARRVKPGALFLARTCRCPIIPVGSAASRHLSLDSGWDRFILPLPFTRVHIQYGEPVWVPASADEAARERIAGELGRRMDGLTEKAGRLVRSRRRWSTR